MKNLDKNKAALIAAAKIRACNNYSCNELALAFELILKASGVDRVTAIYAGDELTHEYGRIFAPAAVKGDIYWDDLWRMTPEESQAVRETMLLFFAEMNKE